MTNLATFRPMLACSTVPQLDSLRYPVYASPKLDGIRCVMLDGLAMSRNMKRIPNKHVFNALQALRMHGFDGELMIDGDFNSVQSAFMSESGCPDFYYNVFDYFGVDDFKRPFKQRIETAHFKALEMGSKLIRVVPHVMVPNAAALSEYWDQCVEEGYEGVIIRDPNGPYKHGRSTMSQGWMMKLKHFEDSEAVVVGVEEMMHNANAAETNALGYTERSHCQDNLVPTGMLGALVVEWRGVQFKIGTGFDMNTRLNLWQQDLVGKHVKFKYQELSKYGVPRFPVWLGFRDMRDMS